MHVAVYFVLCVRVFCCAFYFCVCIFCVCASNFEVRLVSGEANAREHLRVIEGESPKLETIYEFDKSIIYL